MPQIPFDVTEMMQNSVSFFTATKESDDLNLEVLSPQDTYLIKLGNETNAVQIINQAAKDVKLIGHRQDRSQKNISNAESIHYNKQRGFWICSFALNQEDMFDTHKYLFVVTFQIEANDISKPTLSYPYMWQLFHDLNLEVESP